MKNLDLIQKLKQKALQVMPKGATVVLFGSQARGDADTNSDWDILILLKKKRISNSDFDTYAYPLVEFGWEKGEQINPILYTNEEWEGRSFTSFHHNVTQEGIVLCH